MLPALRPSRGNQPAMSANQSANPTTLTLLWLLLLSYGVSHSRCLMIPDNSTDMLSLLDFKQAINYPEGALSSWNHSTPLCLWEGVNCSRKHPGRVTGLSLGGLDLAGPISPSIGNLTFLESLNLSTNSFSGKLPPLNRLHRMKTLVLAQNSLQGAIPDTITNCSNLQYLDLSFNPLTGGIPHGIGLLHNMFSLQLSRNNLTGTIPTSMKNLTLLRALSIADNQLTGDLPDELGKLQNLRGLVIGGNRLSGGLTMFNHSSLLYLDLSINMLGNALPSDFGDRLPNLRNLLLDYNNFEGHIPASLGNISGLLQLDLSCNNFTGLVPSSLGNLGMLTSLKLIKNNLEAKDSQNWNFIGNHSSLEVLVLNENQFQGAIPNLFSKLSENFIKLGLATNDLSGTVPTSIGNLTGLMILELNNNNLNGSIEGWFGNLNNLEGINLEANNFNGPIPSSVGNLNQLTVLSLAENGFEGLIPSSMGNLTKLTYVSLAKNKLQGPVPPDLGNLPMLGVLNLSYNNLQGSLPKEIFHAESAVRSFALSYNNLEGPLHPEISNLKLLTELYISSNKLTGEIPTTLGNCEDLQIIEMDHNFLQGNISAKTFSDLTSLTLLNLSHNNLSGSIPTELGDLIHLTQLDLSYNNLQGNVPENGVFGNAKSVSLLGNWGLCGGVRDLHIRQCPTVSRRKQIQYYLIRVLIPVFGFMSLILLVYFILTEGKMSRQNNLPFPSFGKHLLKVSYNDIAQATQNFSESNLIGKGSYGSVYKGKLMKGKLEVAVKVLDLDMQGAEKSFFAECEALRRIQHRNLVPILTACSTVDNEGKLFKALVYEYMSNGNLDIWLHHKGNGKDPKCLGLTQRINIIVNIADALDYLHNDTGSRTIIHCDVKPCNILLDDDLNARLGDFGIASFFHGSNSIPSGDSSTSTFGVKGTIGYIAPEYAGGGRASTCGDVYSFGIVLLEMLTGKRPTDQMFEQGLTIVIFVEKNFQDDILQVIDDVLREECKPFAQRNSVSEREVKQCLCSLLEVALSCTRQYPSERMNMRQAATKVREIQELYMKGKPNNILPK